MPPSPAMRRSPRRESGTDNHKRGRSFESGIPLKQKDDDLALFNEVQSRERDTFLLQANDDFEDIFSNANKSLYFSDYKLGINIPSRGESSDLLHAEEEKNDYEWLLTPPDTPLFPSLDDEAPQLNLAQRGRPRTQPISISRSSTMENSHRSSRSSASPNRVSPSPQSYNSPFESRGRRATSAPSASPPATFKPATSSLRSSPPSRKPVTPVPRASTPTPRRLSTGSNGSTSSRGSRGNSPSPKVKAWQSTIPGFSTEVPPNLRTSLADRPASYVRGSSPASRNSRQSMSPSASRSISSSHSKGSIGSSGDDDLESFSSVVGGAQRLNTRRVGGFKINNNNNKMPHQQFSKKPSRTLSSSSAPKRSFDLALRQMDHRKGPQNMFRPLLSSVPSSTYHGGISNSLNYTKITRSSSVTTSNTSPGLGLSGGHEPETGPDDVTSEPVQVHVRDNIEDEVFMIEKDGDALNEPCDPATLTAGLSFDGTPDTDSQTGLLICTKCGCRYSPFGIPDNTNLCGECIVSHVPSTIFDPVTKSATADETQTSVVEDKARSGQNEDLVKDVQSSYSEPICNVLSDGSLSQARSEECEPKQVNPDMVDFSKSKADSSEVAGISLLLKRSNSIKGTVVRNTNFSASSISYDGFSYVRDSTNNSMRSISVSSSADFGVNKLTDTLFQRQSSSTKSEVEIYKFDLSTKHHRSGSSLSGTSSHAFHPSSLGTSTLDLFDRSVQVNNEENDTFAPENNNENQTHNTFTPENNNGNQTLGGSGESLLNTSSKSEAAEFLEATEVPLDAVSEGENDRFSPALKHDTSVSSTSSIEERQEDVAVSVADHDTCHTSNIIEESIVLVEHESGPKGRSMTLDEATDTILFCSSIVHNLAHDAATIAIDKENSNVSWPLVPATLKSDLYKPELQTRNTNKRSSKSQRSRLIKEPETDPTEAVNTTETHQPKTRIVGLRDSNNGETRKPPMLESKCNCTIM